MTQEKYENRASNESSHTQTEVKGFCQCLYWNNMKGVTSPPQGLVSVSPCDLLHVSSLLQLARGHEPRGVPTDPSTDLPAHVQVVDVAVSTHSVVEIFPLCAGKRTCECEGQRRNC